MSTVLYHHGILGQKWGVRRYQNSDGSYTNAGRKRYRRKEVERDFQRSIDTHKDAYERVINTGSKISDAADDLGNEYQKAFNNVKQLTPEAKEQVYKQLEQDFGSGCDDEELFNLYSEMYVHDAVMDQVNKNKTLATKREAFNKLQQEYWDDVHSITDGVMEKYKNAIIKDDRYYNDGQMFVNDLLGKKLGTSFNAYLSRHFDDYWVFDTDGYNNAINRCREGLSMDEYNRRQAAKY